MNDITIAPAPLDLWFTVDDCVYNLAPSRLYEPIANRKHRHLARAVLQYALERLDEED